jgi:hypothetical protein
MMLLTLVMVFIAQTARAAGAVQDGTLTPHISYAGSELSSVTISVTIKNAYGKVVKTADMSDNVAITFPRDGNTFLSSHM